MNNHLDDSTKKKKTQKVLYVIQNNTNNTHDHALCFKIGAYLKKLFYLLTINRAIKIH